MTFRCGTNFNIALVTAALGFGLIGGEVGVVARVLAVIFFARFVWSLLHGAPPTIWTVNQEWRDQFLPRPPLGSTRPDDEA